MAISLRLRRECAQNWAPGGAIRRGSSLIEFGLLAPIYILVIGGVIDIGRAITLNSICERHFRGREFSPEQRRERHVDEPKHWPPISPTSFRL